MSYFKRGQTVRVVADADNALAGQEVEIIGINDDWRTRYQVVTDTDWCSFVPEYELEEIEGSDDGKSQTKV